MKHSMHAEYLALAKQLEQELSLVMDEDHDDIRTYYKDEKPQFKLIYGLYEDTKELNIVLSLHISLTPVVAISWYSKIYKIYPWIKLVESHMEDSMGETYLGEDAEVIEALFTEQRVLVDWLEKSEEGEIREFAAAEIVGRARDLKRSYSSVFERDQALREFDMMRKPLKKDEVH